MRCYILVKGTMRLIKSFVGSGNMDFGKVGTLSVVLAVAAISFCVYLPVLKAGFVYDDVSQILIDKYIHEPDNFTEVLTFKVLARDILDRNRPFMVLSLMMDSVFWGLNPFGYHLTSVVLHTLCSVLIFLVFLEIFRHFDQPGSHPVFAAAIGAILFAVHPVNSEAVCGVTFREDLLVGFFTLIALFLAGHFPAKKWWTNVLLILGCAVSSLAAVAGKESGAVVPAILLVYWLIVRRDREVPKWLWLIGCSAVVVAVYVFFLFAIEPQQSVVFTKKPPMFFGGSIGAFLKVQPRIWVFQLGSLFWPAKLSADYTPYSLRHITTGTALIVLVVLFMAAIVIAKKNRLFALGILFYGLAVLPISNFFPQYHPFADRYMYFPMVGFSLTVSSIIYLLKTPQRFSKRLFTVIAVVVLGILSILTVQRTFVWQNERSLWEDTVRKDPFSAAAYNYLGFALYEDGEFTEALAAFSRSCELLDFFQQSDQGEPFAGLALTYEALGQPAMAEEYLYEAAKRDEAFMKPEKLVKRLEYKQKEADKLQKIAGRVFQK